MSQTKVKEGVGGKEAEGDELYGQMEEWSRSRGETSRLATELGTEQVSRRLEMMAAQTIQG